MFRSLWVLMSSLFVLCPVQAAEPPALFDAHLHYNREPEARYALPEVLRLFDQAGVRGILATSRPNTGTHTLYAARSARLQVVPFLRPYRVRSDIQTWFADPATMRLIEEEFRHGYFVGIGEFHLHGNEARNPEVARVVAFARDKKLMLHAHSDVAALEILFALDPQARIVWAHTGFSLPVGEVEAMLTRYPGLTAELSYRNGIVDAGGRLDPGWRRLFERHPTRFLLGSDTWIDARWEQYGEIMGAYRGWLAQLPPDVAARIAWGNAAGLFGLAAPH